MGSPVSTSPRLAAAAAAARPKFRRHRGTFTGPLGVRAPLPFRRRSMLTLRADRRRSGPTSTGRTSTRGPCMRRNSRRWWIGEHWGGEAIEWLMDALHGSRR